MKLSEEKYEENRILGEETDSIKASISQDALVHVFDTMSKTLYSKPINAIVREITSNCFDSHIEAGVEDAVVIQKSKDDEGQYISFIDYGVGISPERVKNVYMNYFSSTKRSTNEQIGGFGLGSKTPLAYTNYFYINTVVNNIKYQYILSKQSGIPVLDLLSQEETTERNGTEIRIYFVDEYRDINLFEQALLTELCYFSNVYFIGWNINNNYNIYDNKYFKYKNIDQYSSDMHIILGKVSYPIDWNIIDTERIPISVGVKFEIGELPPTNNREGIRYTEEAIALIKERVELAYNEILELYKSQNKEFTNYFEWKNVYKNRPYILFKTENVEDKLYLNNIKDVFKSHKLSFLRIAPELKDFFTGDNPLKEMLSFVSKVSNKVKDKKHAYYTIVDNYSQDSVYITNKDNINELEAFLISYGAVFKFKKLNLNKLHFYTSLKDKTSKDLLVSKLLRTEKIDFTNEFCSFNLGVSVRAYNVLKEFKKQIKEYYQEIPTATEEDLQRFKDYKIDTNATLRRKLQQKIYCKYPYSSRSGFEWSLDHIEHFTGLVIYGFREDTRKLMNVYKAFMQIKRFRDDYNINNKAIKIIQIAQNQAKYFKSEKGNMIHVDNFYSDNKVFRELASSFKIQRYFETIANSSSYSIEEKIKQIDEIAPILSNHLNCLYNYYKNSSYKPKYHNDYRDDIKKSILEVADKYNLFDEKIETVFKQIDSYLKGVEIFMFTEITEFTTPYLIKLLVDNKKKVNIDFYKQHIIEDKYILKGEIKNQLSLELVSEIPTEQTKLKLILKKAA